MRLQLLGVEEFNESLFQVIRIGSHISSTGELKVNPVHFLESVLEHGAIDLSEKLAINANGGLRVDAEKVAVIGGVVNLAQAESVGNNGSPPGV